MTYKESLHAAMLELDKDEKRRYLGYGIRYGARAGGSFNGISDDKMIECPVCENLMLGMAIGLSLKGLKPVVYFERFDFLILAADALCNHLDAAKIISRGEFNPAVIIRVVVGNSQKPLFTGHTHTRDYGVAISQMVNFKVWRVNDEWQFGPTYKKAADAQDAGESSIVIEMKDKI